MSKQSDKSKDADNSNDKDSNNCDICFKSIGVIHSPYINNAPYQPRKEEDETFIIEINEEYARGLRDLEQFDYLFVIFYMHLRKDSFNPDTDLFAFPPWIGGKSVGLFASRSPNRPNPIGMSILKIRFVEGNKIYVDGIDAYEGTPVLDIKPYIQRLDMKEDSNNGWLDLENEEIRRKIEEHLRDHLREHLKALNSDDVPEELLEHIKRDHGIETVDKLRELAEDDGSNEDVDNS